jgi:hypothetical protein
VDIRCAPAGGVEGGVRVIEQGELVANKYGVRAIALRAFDQALAAGVRSLVRPGGPPAAEGHLNWESALQVVAEGSRTHYQCLVLESPGFSDYYRLATPADVIERMRRGSGPEAGLVDGLLAAAGTAPWVFAWTQSRNILPGWYGFGTGFYRPRGSGADAEMHAVGTFHAGGRRGNGLAERPGHRRYGRRWAGSCTSASSIESRTSSSAPPPWSCASSSRGSCSSATTRSAGPSACATPTWTR